MIKVVIGGLGSSGTRLPAMIFQHMGLLVTDKVTPRLDWHRFTPVFHMKPERWTDELRKLVPTGEVFKEPHTAQLIENCFAAWPGMKYVYVVRHGLEYAFRGMLNTNQYNGWAVPLKNHSFTLPPTPSKLLDYWIYLYDKMRELAKSRPIYFFNWNRCVEHPKEVIDDLMQFCGYTPDSATYSIPSKPPTWQCYKGDATHRYGLPSGVFSKDQLAAVERLGFKP